MEEVSELQQGIVKVLRGCLASDLLIENTHSARRSELLVRCQGRGRSGRFGSREGNDVWAVLAVAPER